MSVPPSGITPAASFELAGFEPELPPPAILADMIDPVTGDFASLTKGRSIADGLAQHLLAVQRGTGASVLDFGQRFREITHADGEAVENFEAYAREALKPGVDSGTLRFDRISTVINPADGTQAENEIKYIDLLAPPKEQGRQLTFKR